MTDPVHIAAERLLNYFDGDADSGGETMLHYRPYLTILIDELRAALGVGYRNAALEEAEQQARQFMREHDPATCKYCAPIPRQPVESSVRHDAPSR